MSLITIANFVHIKLKNKKLATNVVLLNTFRLNCVLEVENYRWHYRHYRWLDTIEPQSIAADMFDSGPNTIDSAIDSWRLTSQ